MTTKTTIRRLPVRITEEEQRDLGKELAESIFEQEGKESAAKESARQFKNEIAEIVAQSTRLSQILHDGAEYRDVKCEIHIDMPEPGRKTTIRTDTGEIVEVKPMTDGDSQGELL